MSASVTRKTRIKATEIELPATCRFFNGTDFCTEAPTVRILIGTKGRKKWGAALKRCDEHSDITEKDYASQGFDTAQELL